MGKLKDSKGRSHIRADGEIAHDLMKKVRLDLADKKNAKDSLKKAVRAILSARIIPKVILPQERLTMGRLLAYAIRRGGLNLNRTQVRRGWAEVYVYAGVPFRRVRSFRRAQRTARQEHRGVWRLCGGDFHTPER